MMPLMFVVAALVMGMSLIWQRFVHKKRENELIDNLQTMVASAANGTLQLNSLEETKLSSLENSLYMYLMRSRVISTKLAEQKESMQRLISDVSHQCTTPISNIVLYSELLKETEAGQCDRISLIHQQAEKLDFLIKTLVKMSRMENGVIQPVLKQQPVQPLFTALQLQFQSVAERRGVTLRIEPTDSTALFDKKWTGEALANIVDNALKYSAAGGKVKVSAVSYSLFSKICIADDGPGIAEEEQNLIFQRFYRSDSAAETDGIGVGLSLARQIMKAQGGYIRVSSKENHGAVFSVFLPND
ncbi:sensor histidine kinase [Vagococcus acidifermentans]|uniref:histidine kinase n=1 Tax=Vagococcus acidifermentans TaxID=564710 RepID=A0A430ASX2_9ENTE|nr:HAMP domain-containing sensor histidine kinase [Vagococcus acidifermentans]RSU11158.1 hypothetical protein CBF27_08635 [Vagococcus acidifermentans]